MLNILQIYVNYAKRIKSIVDTIKIRHNMSNQLNIYFLSEIVVTRKQHQLRTTMTASKGPMLVHVRKRST